jgi:hypothetical protein
MVFQKEASRGISFAREGLVSAGCGAQTINRVELKMVELPGNFYRLKGTAYMATGGDDPFFQNEVPLPIFGGAPISPRWTTSCVMAHSGQMGGWCRAGFVRPRPIMDQVVVNSGVRGG